MTERTSERYSVRYSGGGCVAVSHARGKRVEGEGRGRGQRVEGRGQRAEGIGKRSSGYEGMAFVTFPTRKRRDGCHADRGPA